MLKKLSCLTVLVAFTVYIFSFSVFAAPSAADRDLEYNAVTAAKILDKVNVLSLKAKASVLMDAGTGSVLLENNSDAKLPIASVTKVMTMLLIMEAIDSGKLTFDDRVPVTESSYRMGGSQVYLREGEEFSVSEMLKAVAIHSANDASVALGEKVAGSEEAFVKMMNEKAKELGMENTNFLDCTGLTDEGHYSSARDIAVMSRELIVKYPKILEYTSIWHDTFRDGKFSLDNTNRMIRFYPGSNGLKTGFTNKAGFCLSASARKNGLQLISVVLGEPDSNTRFAESRKLLDYGFANYETSKVNSKGEIIQQVEVKNGLKSKVNGVLAHDAELLVKKGEKTKVDNTVKMEENIKAPVKEGQKLGEIIYKVDGNEALKVDIVSDNEVQRASFIKLFWVMLSSWFTLGRY